MTRPIRIGNVAGLFGDRPSAMREMVEGGPIDVLTGDYLAELTMLILARTRMKRPDGGFARTFVSQLEEVMGTCLDRGIKVVSNAGGLDPAACAAAIERAAEGLGLSPTVAYVDGDDLMARIHELAGSGDLTAFDPRIGLGDPSAYLTANAYLGCWGIVEALDRGADIVVTGRVTDAAVTCGPAAWHHGWSRDDFDALAGAVVAGHILECGAQATGGNYSFFTEIPGYDDAEGGARFGFPWADIEADGSAVIGKHDGTGGEVSIGTVTSQLLYEIGGSAYLGPDVSARFDTVQLEAVGADRVRVHGTRGEPPPSTLKVAINELGGFRNTLEVALTGLEIEEKATFVEAAFWNSYPYDRSEVESVTTELIRSDKLDASTNAEATAVWRITLKDPDETKVGRAFTNALIHTALASIPGLYALSGAPTGGRPYGIYRPALVPAELVPQVVHIRSEEVTVSSVVQGEGRPVDLPSPRPPGSPSPESLIEAPLGSVVGARSGDKGGDANLGVFARSAEAWAWLEQYLTIERLQQLLPEVIDLTIERHVFPNLWSLNFVIRGLLDEGVAASTRQDVQAKSLGEWFRSRHASIPERLIGE